VSEVGLAWVSPPPTTARLVIAGEAGSEDIDVVLDGEPDADDPDDVWVDSDAEDFAADPDDAEETVEGEPEEEASESDVEPTEDEFESFTSALATPCPVNTAAPTPKATASPPTLPTYAAALISFLFLGMLRDRTNCIAVLIPEKNEVAENHRNITDRSQRHLAFVCAGQPRISEESHTRLNKFCDLRHTTNGQRIVAGNCGPPAAVKRPTCPEKCPNAPNPAG